MLEEMVAWQPPSGGNRSVPVHRSEYPTGYSSAGCSPAEPASASPVTDNSSSIPIQRGNQAMLNLATWVEWSCPPAMGVSFLLCTPGVISILRRQRGEKRKPPSYYI